MLLKFVLLDSFMSSKKNSAAQYNNFNLINTYSCIRINNDIFIAVN